MALRTLVKVGEITNLSDARYCAGMGVELLGFNVQPDSDDFIGPDEFKEITEWVAGVQFVGEVGNDNLDYILQVIEEYGFDLIQLPVDSIELKDKIDLPVIVEVDSLEDPLFTDVVKASYYLVTGQFETEKLKEVSTKYPILVGAGVFAETVNEQLDVTDIKGVALAGSKEERPGYKDYDELADILEALEIED